MLILLALVFVAGLLWFWLGGSERQTERRLASAPQTPPADPRAPAELAPVPPPAAQPTPTEAGTGELEPFASARTTPALFAGKLGSLRGHIEVSGEEPFPRNWRLVLRASKTLPAREHAAPRTLDFSDGRADFEVPDVPLGGYDVCGEAAGFSGQIHPVLLEPGNEHPFVNLRMVPAGLLEGRILDARRNPAEGIPVTLFALADNAASEAWTDANGLFRFERVADGAYELLVGKATAPLLPERRPVRFQAPRLTFPDIELPALGEIHVRVVDSLARPLEGVEVRGSGTNGGLVEGRTDFDGRLVVRHLPAGHFRLRLAHPSFAPEYERRVAVDVVAGQVAEAPVRLGP